MSENPDMGHPALWELREGSRFPAGMTERKARAKAGCLRDGRKKNNRKCPRDRLQVRKGQAKMGVVSLLRKVVVVLVAVFSVSAGARAETVDKLPKPTAYVSDFANVMDAASIRQMENICGQIERKAHAQIAVVTVNDTGGEDVFQFTQDLQQKWGVGTKPDDRGILMLFAIHDRKRWINVGKGLEGILNDAKVGDIGRAMVPQLKTGEYGPAALSGVQQIAGVIAADAGVTLDAPVQPTYRQQTARQSSGRGFGIGGIIFFLVIAFLIFGRGRGGRGGGGGGGGLGWLLLGSMLGGGGRGFGGGGSGGGDNEGGGGGGFGGFGGGDSGGGGAGGDF